MPRSYQPPIACLVLLACGAVGLSSCSSDPGYEYPPVITFNDDAQANTEVDAATINGLKFVDSQGQEVDLEQYKGERNVVLVITRGVQIGYSAPGWPYDDVCLYCATQTAGLITQYPEFQSRNAEVLVVYPVLQSTDASKLARFQEAVASLDSAAGDPPFPLLLDVELKAVDQLGIRENLARPAVYILDKNGRTRFAYVGQTLADRPSALALLGQLDLINAPDP